MALIKQITLPTGEQGDYWKLIEVNCHTKRGSVATLQLYKSKTLRMDDAQPMDKALQFVFAPEDIETVDPDENLPNGWRDVWFHSHYLAIKSVMASGVNKPTEERTENEMMAEVLYGATDDL